MTKQPADNKFHRGAKDGKHYWLATEDHSEGEGTGRHIACFVLEP